MIKCTLAVLKILKTSGNGFDTFIVTQINFFCAIFLLSYLNVLPIATMTFGNKKNTFRIKCLEIKLDRF